MVSVKSLLICFRPFKVTATAALIALGIASVAQAATVTVPVSEDESVYWKPDDPDFNLDGSTINGGLFSGVDGAWTDSAARFYLKFDLPTYKPESRVASATLTGYYNYDYNPDNDGTHGIYFVASDSWTESTITWTNQPGQSFGLPEASFDAADAEVGTFASWDITNVAAQEYQGDGMLSLLFHAERESLTSENQNWEYFAEREYDRTKAFRIELTTVPEPSSALATLAFGVLGVGLVLKRIRK